MSSRAVTVALYVLIVVAGLALELLGRGGRTRIPPLGVVLSKVMRTRSGRIAVVTGWAWLGLHFFAR
jgi:Family of unknown function (DUF6186)